MTGAQRNNAIRKALAEAYPEVTFTVEACSPSGRNGYKHLGIYWTGGPLADVVKCLVDPIVLSDMDRVRHFKVGYGRTMSDAEFEDWNARLKAEEPAREAARETQKAVNKQRGIEQRARTVQARRELQDKLAASFPGVEFAITTVRKSFALEWTGGPSRAEVAKVHSHYSNHRYSTPEEVRAEREREALAACEAQELVDKLNALGITKERNAWSTLSDVSWCVYDSLDDMRATYRRVRKQRSRLARTLRFLSGRKFVAAPRNPRPAPAQLRLPIALPVWMFAIPKQTRLASRR